MYKYWNQNREIKRNKATTIAYGWAKPERRREILILIIHTSWMRRCGKATIRIQFTRREIASDFTFPVRFCVPFCVFAFIAWFLWCYVRLRLLFRCCLCRRLLCCGMFSVDSCRICCASANASDFHPVIMEISLSFESERALCGVAVEMHEKKKQFTWSFFSERQIARIQIRRTQ